MSDKKRRLYNKFTVTRNDGRDKPDEKHYGCRYFVLDLDHDPFAIDALRAYQEACWSKYPSLAVDLMRICSKNKKARQSALAEIEGDGYE